MNPFDAAHTTREGEVLVTLQEAASKVSVPVGTLYSWVSRHKLVPTGYGPGRKAMFRLSEVEHLARNTTRRRARGPEDA